MRYTDRYTF